MGTRRCDRSYFIVRGILIFKCDRAFSKVTPDNTLGDESLEINPRIDYYPKTSL